MAALFPREEPLLVVPFFRCEAHRLIVGCFEFEVWAGETAALHSGPDAYTNEGGDR